MGTLPQLSEGGFDDPPRPVPTSVSRMVTPVVLSGTQQRDILARNGQAYRLFVARPLHPPPEAGYPVIYLLDANAAFGTMTETVRLQSARPQVTGVPPAVVVGIGYPTDLPLDLVRRTYDYTPAVARDALSPRPDGTPWPPTGGADAFLDFIEQDVKPAVAKDIPIDATRQVLFGHSFGGLLALYALFTRPRAFQTYVAGSPSIWFGDRAILAAERTFGDGLHAVPQTLRLLIGVGSLEQTLTERERNTPELAPRAAWVENNRMVDNARELAARLGALASDQLTVSYQEFEGESHVSVIPALVSRAVRFAFPPSP